VASGCDRVEQGGGRAQVCGELCRRPGRGRHGVVPRQVRWELLQNRAVGADVDYLIDQDRGRSVPIWRRWHTRRRVLASFAGAPRPLGWVQSAGSTELAAWWCSSAHQLGHGGSVVRSALSVTPSWSLPTFVELQPHRHGFAALAAVNRGGGQGRGVRAGRGVKGDAIARRRLQVGILPCR
jgi:hypothetical protein